VTQGHRVNERTPKHRNGLTVTDPAFRPVTPKSPDAHAPAPVRGFDCPSGRLERNAAPPVLSVWFPQNLGASVGMHAGVDII